MNLFNFYSKILFLALPVIFCIEVCAQSVNTEINGKVLDAASNQQIGFATILYFTQNTKGFKIANQTGGFQFELSTIQLTDTIRFQVSAVGYQPLDTTLLIKTIPANGISLYLHPFLGTLDSVRIIGKPPMEVKEDTIRYNTIHFADGTEKNIGELLSKMPGFEVSASGKITYNKRYVNRLLIDATDMAGTDYGTLARTFQAEPVEYVDVIENYKNTDDIFESMGTAKELVVNLGIKEAYKQVIFGKLHAAQDALGPRQEAGGDLNFIGKELKLVSNLKWSKLGQLAQPIDNPNNPFGGANINPVFDDNISQYADNIQPNINRRNLNNILNNNSLLAPVYAIVKLHKQVQVQARLNIVSDVYAQQNTTTVDVLQSTQPIRQFSATTLAFKNRNILPELILRFTPSERFQVIAQQYYRHATQAATDSGVLQQFSVQHLLDRRQSESISNLTVNGLLSPKVALRAVYNYRRLQGENLYISENPAFGAFFTGNVLMDGTSLQSNSTIRQNMHEGFLQIKSRAKKLNWNTKLGFIWQHAGINDDLMVLNGTPVKIHQDSSTNGQLSRRMAVWESGLSYKFSKKWDVSMNGKLNYLMNDLLPSIDTTNLERNILAPAYQINTTYRINKETNISLSGNIGYNLENISFLFGGFRPAGSSGLMEGSGQFSGGFGKGLGANFFKIHSKRTFWYLMSGIQYNHIPKQYIAEQLNNPLLFIGKYIPTDLDRKQWLQHFNVGARVFGLRKLALSSMLMHSKDFIIQQSRLTPVSGLYMKNELQAVKEIGAFEITTGAVYDRFVQRLNVNNIKNTNSNIELHTKAVFKPNDQIAATIQNHYMHFFTNGKALGSGNNLQASFQYFWPKQKLETSIEGTNLLGLQSIQFVTASQNFISTNNQLLFPRMVVIRVAYKF